jgi:hypothetical protein
MIDSRSQAHGGFETGFVCVCVWAATERRSYVQCAGLRATRPVTCPTKATDGRPSTPHLEFSQSITTSIPIIEPVQPIVVIREIEAGSSLDLNAHVDIVPYSGNRATAVAPATGGSARRKPSTQQIVQAVLRRDVICCGLLWSSQNALVPRCQSPTRPREIHRQTQRRRHSQFLVGSLSFFNSPISARPPSSPFKMTWELTRRRFTRAINSKYLFDRVVCLTWPRLSFLGALVVSDSLSSS